MGSSSLEAYPTSTVLILVTISGGKWRTVCKCGSWKKAAEKTVNMYLLSPSGGLEKGL